MWKESALERLSRLKDSRVQSTESQNLVITVVIEYVIGVGAEARVSYFKDDPAILLYCLRKTTTYLDCKSRVLTRCRHLTVVVSYAKVICHRMGDDSVVNIDLGRMWQESAWNNKGNPQKCVLMTASSLAGNRNRRRLVHEELLK
jgi:hypothetical protein